MSRYNFGLTLAFVAQLPLAVCRAESAPTPTAPQLLLRDDHQLARWVTQRSPDVQAERATLQAERSAAAGARLLINPTLDVGASNLALGQTNPPGYPRGKTLQYDVGISETLEIGKRGPRIAAADLSAAAAQARLQSTVADRIANARAALAELVYTRARLQQLQASLVEARAAALIAHGRLAHQALSGVDYDRLLIDLAIIETDQAHAEADTQVAMAQCEAALQAPCEVDEPGIELLDLAAPVPPPTNAHDLTQRADIVALNTDAHAATQSAKLAAARALPDLTFRLGYTYTPFTISGSLANSLALSVAAPLPFFDRGQYAQAEALAQADQARARARAQLVQARGDLSGLYARKRAVEGALYNLEHDSLPRANATLEAEERGLKEGQLDLNDLLLARRAAISLRLQTLQLHFELFQVRNALRQVMGLDQALTQG